MKEENEELDTLEGQKEECGRTLMVEKTAVSPAKVFEEQEGALK